MGNGRTEAIRSDPLWVAGKSGQDWIGGRLKMERPAAGGGTRHPEGGFSRPLLTLIQEVGRMSATPPPQAKFRPGSAHSNCIGVLLFCSSFASEIFRSEPHILNPLFWWTLHNYPPIIEYETTV